MTRTSPPSRPRAGHWHSHLDDDPLKFYSTRATGPGQQQGTRDVFRSFSPYRFVVSRRRAAGLEQAASPWQPEPGGTFQHTLKLQV
eukprot:539736-Rhodomonas_salina.1